MSWPLNAERCTDRASRREAERIVNTHHSYIRWADRPSRKLYWLLFNEAQVVGVWGLGSCFSRPQAVQAFMTEHALSFNGVGNNIVFCMAPCGIPNAGSTFLALCRRDAVRWWRERYDDDLRVFQTFVLPPRNGAVYRADNWTFIGETVGAPQRIHTLRPDEDVPDGARVLTRTFKSGEVRRFVREQSSGETPKLIFMRMA